MGNDLRYGIIGAGSMGREHIQNLKIMGGVEIAAISDPYQPSQQAAAALAPSAKLFSDHRTLLEDSNLDAIIIATPNDTHAAVLKDALATNLAVFVEKPLATNVEDLKSILKWNENRSEITWVGLEYRFIPPVAEAIARANSGAVGKVQQVSIREHREPFYSKIDNWNRFAERTGGTLVEKCCHYFNLMDLIIGQQPIRVFASGSQSVNHLDEVYGSKSAN
ncbi:MAG: Gfo/Idh/MocA family oxidoreductase, partial [Acidobacteria bacterium]|nr:Gfo/Idh/MocA family oxidoreductase [Acidobacteriota bacterium]